MDGFFFRHDETLNFKITKHKRKFLFTKTSQFMTFLRRVQKSQLIAKVSAVQERKQFLLQESDSLSAAALESGSGAHHGGRGAIKTVQVCDMESLQ